MKYGDIKEGSKVRTLRELRNHCNIVPVGSIGLVKKKYGGLELYFENQCEHCKFGERIWITRVPVSDVQLIKTEG